jgi:hypothetical protein
MLNLMIGLPAGLGYNHCRILAIPCIGLSFGIATQSQARAQKTVQRDGENNLVDNAAKRW